MTVTGGLNDGFADPWRKQAHRKTSLDILFGLIDIANHSQLSGLFMTSDTTLEHNRLLAGVLIHVSRYLESGCQRAAHQAGLLLSRLDDDAMDEDLVSSCERLDLALSKAPCAPSSTRHALAA